MNKFTTLLLYATLLITVASALGLVGRRADARPVVVAAATQQQNATPPPEKFVFRKLPKGVFPPDGPSPDHDSNRPSVPPP
ncbi:hypothetical protein ABFS83_13G023700 [Erythranthe nasuta]